MIYKPRNDIDQKYIDEYFAKQDAEIKRKQEIVQSKEYEEWLIDFIDKYDSVTDWEDLYVYSKPEGISDQDVENIFLLTYYLDYKEVIKQEKINLKDIGMVDLFKIEPDIQTNIIIRGKTYLLERVAGCGCYVHTISQIK